MSFSLGLNVLGFIRLPVFFVVRFGDAWFVGVFLATYLVY